MASALNVLQSARDTYRAQARIVAAAQVAMRAVRGAPDRSLAVMVSFQQEMARVTVDAAPSMLSEQGIEPESAFGTSFAPLLGAASDGRPLRSLLSLPDSTYAEFDRIVATQLQDVARQAAAIERAARPQVTTYVRALNLPSCGRCIVLAGRVEADSTAFQRHPRCDCLAVPSDTARAGKLVTTPRDAWDALSKPEREKAFTKAGAEAIELGADVQRVVNARRGMSTAQNPDGLGRFVGGRLARNEDGIYVTTELVKPTRRGTPPRRLMPESIMELYDTHEDRIAALKAHKYIF